MSRIACRGRIAKACLNGQPEEVAFEEGMSEDGTFDGQSIVCDPCYVALMPLTPSGRGLLAELPAAIAAARS